MFKKVFEYAGPHKKDLYIATFIVLLSVLMGVLPFVLAYQVIAPLVMGESIEASFITLRVVLVLVCLVLQALFYGWGLNLSHKAAYDTLLRLRTALQKRFEKLPLGVIQDKGTGTVKKLFVDDVDSLEVLLAHSMPEGNANLMIPIAVYVAMFFVDWKLALLSLASIPISLIAMMTMYSVGMKKMGPYYMAGQKMNNTIIEYINGMEVVKVFNKDADSYERFRKDVSDYRDYTLAWYKAAWPWMAIYSSLLPCTIILTLPFGAWFVLSGWSTLPNLILVLCLSLSIGMPLLKSLGFLPTMPQLNYKISALEQVLDAPELQQTEDAFHGKDDTITYDHVSFAYQTTQPGPDGKPVVIEDEVLHDISFTAKAGQKTALVGESGSGKSTLAKLLIHYYDPQKGSISIGGQKLCDMSLEALNSRISYVAQDQYLFNTSLLENIRLGRLNATDEEVVEAAKKAQCMEFLEKLPQGIHSMAGDAGKMLSGGQRQRISLARAILKDAPIVVLDEATAYADPENEEKMEAAIAELVKGKTLVVIAHKLPAITPYGYLKAKDDCHQLIIDPVAAVVVQRMFRWASEGAGLNTIAVRLNEAGILTPSHYKKMQGKITHENLLGSGKWQTRTVGVILRSEVYTGDLVQGQTKTVDHRQVKADAEEWTVVRDTHEAIISREQFAAVQEILNQTASRAKAREVKAFTPNLLKGKVFCAHCGGSLYRQRNIRKKSDDVYFYHCLSQSRISKDACPGVTIREDMLLDMLADMLQDALDTALGQYTLSLAELPQQAADRAELREKITSRKQEIQRLRGIVRSLYENLVQGVLTKDEYFDYKEKYESRIADLAVEMEQLEDGLRTMDTQIEQHRALEQDAAQIKTDRALTGVLIDRLIDRIEVSHDKQITVRYRFQSEFETYAEVLEQCRNM